jgi:hypothetical protein
MREAHGPDAKVMRFVHLTRPYDRCMLRAEIPYTRTLTLVLPESEWRALRDAEPDAVGWLHSQIRNRLTPVDTAERRPPSIRSEDAAWDEEY